MKEYNFKSYAKMKKAYKTNEASRILYDFSILEAEAVPAQAIDEAMRNDSTIINDFSFCHYIDSETGESVYIDLDFSVYAIENEYKRLYVFKAVKGARITKYKRNIYGAYTDSASPAEYKELGSPKRDLYNPIQHITITA